MTISTRNLASLPDIPTLRGLMQSLATLDAIMSPERHSRYYSFNAQWGPHEEMGSMNHGLSHEAVMFCDERDRISGTLTAARLPKERK